MINIFLGVMFLYFVGVSPINEQKKILIFGDSITKNGRYVAKLRSLTTDYTFDRYSVEGKSSTFFRMVIEKYDGFEGVDGIIIQCGVNNIDNPNQIIADFDIIRKIAQKDNVKLYILSIMPFRGYPSWTTQKQKNLEKVNNWLKSQKDLVYIDTYSILADENGYNKYSTDHLHPNDDGQDLIGEKINTYLK
jgi:lysophospholipase L1-like esterase